MHVPSDFNTVSVLCSVMWVAGWRVNISTGCNYYYYYDSVVGGKQQERDTRGHAIYYYLVLVWMA